MEIENLRKQEPGSNDPFQGNRWFRIAIIVLGALAVIGVLLFLLIILGFCAPNRIVTTNPTARPPATAVVIVETQAPPTPASQQVTAAPATATLVVGGPTTAPTSEPAAQPTTAAPGATTAAASDGAQPTTASPASEQPTASANASLLTRTPAARPGPLGELYIGALRYDPPNPVRNDPVNFYVTMLNRTGKEQNYPLCVEIYLPDKAKPLGTTDCNNVTIPTGTSQVPVGFWIGTGIKQCVPFRARAVMREQGGEARIPLTDIRGDQLWTDFSVCP